MRSLESTEAFVREVLFPQELSPDAVRAVALKVMKALPNPSGMRRVIADAVNESADPQERAFKAGWDAYKALHARERSPHAHTLNLDKQRAYDLGLKKLREIERLRTTRVELADAGR